MSQEPSPARVVIGCFLLLAGTCLVLLGGGCTLGVMGEVGRPHSGPDHDFSGLILTISLFTFAVGALLVWGGLRLLKRRDDDE
jgi:hypothetical protein